MLIVVLLGEWQKLCDEIIKQAENHGMIAVIPPRKNRKVQRDYDKALYKLQHLVENAFLLVYWWK